MCQATPLSWPSKPHEKIHQQHANIRKRTIKGFVHPSLGDVDLLRNTRVDVVSFHRKRFFKVIYAHPPQEIRP